MIHLVALKAVASRHVSLAYETWYKGTGSHCLNGLGFEGLHSSVLCLVLQPPAVCLARPAGIGRKGTPLPLPAVQSFKSTTCGASCLELHLFSGPFTLLFNETLRLSSAVGIQAVQMRC